MALYEENAPGSKSPAPARWRATREAAEVEPEAPAPRSSSLQDTHGVFLVDYLTELAKEYPPVQPWGGELFSAMVGATPALSSDSCPSRQAAHAQAHLHLISCEVGRLLKLYPGAVLAGLVEGLKQPVA